MCFVSPPIPSPLLMVQRNPLQAMWYHLVLSWCTVVSEAKRRGVQESKNIDHTKHHTPHCWLPAKVMYPTNSIKRFSWLTRSTSTLLMKNVQIYTLSHQFVNQQTTHTNVVDEKRTGSEQQEEAKIMSEDSISMDIKTWDMVGWELCNVP